LADALRGLGIDLDVVDYNEHTIGTSKDAKAATYIGCTAAQSSQKVWGVGIHHDVVQASLIAMLSAASSFLSSRPTTPIPFRPKRSNTLEIPSPASSPTRTAKQANGSTIVDKLEAAVNGSQADVKSAGV